VSQKVLIDHESFDAYLRDRRHWKKSRRYHYLSILRDLELIDTSDARIRVQPLGKELVEIGKDNFGNLSEIDSCLSSKEIDFFKQCLLSYRPFAKFLSLFLEENKLPTNYSEFLSEAKAVGLDFKKEEQDEIVEGIDDTHVRLSGWRVLKANGMIESLSRTEQPAVMWTLKYWAKSLDLIDEIWIPEFHGYTQRFEKALFPVKTDHPITLEIFQQNLDSLIEEKKYPSNYIPIPILIHDFCTSFFVRVRTFLNLLCSLHLEVPGDYYLDRVARAYIDERLHSIGRVFRRKEEGWQSDSVYTNYPKIDGYYCSHLVYRKTRR
jgi:hypothetical protein